MKVMILLLSVLLIGNVFAARMVNNEIDFDIEEAQKKVNSYFNSKDKNGDTPLHHAVCVGDSKSVEFLINNGAIVNRKNNNFATPINCINRSNIKRYCKIVQLLLDKGADINNKTKDTGSTALHRVQGYNGRFYEVTKLLLEYGANPNIQDHTGCTPLHKAMDTLDGCVQNHKQCGLLPLDTVRILINYGANPEIRNGKGKTALELMKKHSHFKENLKVLYVQYLMRKIAEKRDKDIAVDMVKEEHKEIKLCIDEYKEANFKHI